MTARWRGRDAATWVPETLSLLLPWGILGLLLGCFVAPLPRCEVEVIMMVSAS